MGDGLLFLGCELLSLGAFVSDFGVLRESPKRVILLGFFLVLSLRD